jgi:hypothetical protein
MVSHVIVFSIHKILLEKYLAVVSITSHTITKVVTAHILTLSKIHFNTFILFFIHQVSPVRGFGRPAIMDGSTGGTLVVQPAK